MILHYLSMMIFFKIDRFILPLLMILTKSFINDILKLLLLSNKGFTAHKTNYIKKEFLEQWKKNAWSENEDRDDFAFWEQQKKECLEVNPL